MNRKDLINAYKERKPKAGIFAVRCAPTGDVWIGESRNLDAQQNSVWFTLRNGSHINRAIQSVWNAQGADAFAFEVLETLPEEGTPYVLASMLRERSRHWLAELKAVRL